jgi:hypothetical protein
MMQSFASNLNRYASGKTPSSVWIVATSDDHEVHPCKLDLCDWRLLRGERTDLIRSDHNLFALLLVRTSSSRATCGLAR